MLKKIGFLLCLLGLIPSLAAQTSSFSCEDESRYDNQAEVLIPAMSAESPELLVTAIGLGDFDPVLAVSNADGLLSCSFSDARIGNYSGHLPLADTFSSEGLNAQTALFEAGQHTLRIGELEQGKGTVLLIIEGEVVEERNAPQAFNFTVSPEMQSISAYVFSLDNLYPAQLDLVDSQAQRTSAIAFDSIFFTSPTDESANGVGLEVPLQAGEIQLLLPNRLGRYALILTIETGQTQAIDGIAHIEQWEDGSLLLSCDGQPVFENGTRLRFLEGTAPYTVTALGLGNYDPVIAVLDAPITGFCYDNQATASDYAVDLPSIQLESQFTSAQAEIPLQQNFILGSQGSQAGEVVLMIEGGNLAADSTGDILEISLSPYLVLAAADVTAYAIAAENNLNLRLEWLSDSGRPLDDINGLSMQCDDAGTRTCQAGTGALPDGSLRLAGRGLPAFELDAMLRLPLEDSDFGQARLLRVSAVDGTSGAYVLVLHLISD